MRLADRLVVVGAFLAGGCSLLTGASDLHVGAPDDESAPDGSVVDGTVDDARLPQLDGALEASGKDAAADASPARCDLAKPFGAPVLVGGIGGGLGGAGSDFGCTLTRDERTIYFSSDRPGGSGGFDLYTATRANADAPFSAATPMLAVNTADDERHPSITSDGLALVFRTSPPGGVGDVLLALRLATLLPFGKPTPVANVNSAQEEADPFVTPSGDAIYLARTGGIFVAARQGLTYGTPTPVQGLAGFSDPTLSDDELTMFVALGVGGAGQNIQVATRASKSAAFGAPVDVPALNSTAADQPDWLSPDGCRLYLTSARSGPPRLYVAARPL